MSHTEYSAQFVQYSSVFLGLEEALGRLASLYSVDFQHFSTITYTEICNLNLQFLASVEQD
jgi:hypothetical protein